MGHQVTGFWINYDHLHDWWMTHDLPIPWDGIEGNIGFGLHRYLAANAGLTSRLASMNPKVKVDYFDISRKARPGNKSSEDEVFLFRRYKRAVEPEDTLRKTDEVFADKLLKVGLTKFVCAVLVVDDRGGRTKRSDTVLYNAECDSTRKPSTKA